MRAIYRFDVDHGRGYQIHSVFSAEKEAVEKVMGKEVYFGEVCGKHSEMAEVVLPTNLKMITDDPTTVRLFDEVGLSCGINPVEVYETWLFENAEVTA